MSFTNRVVQIIKLSRYGWNTDDIIIKMTIQIRPIGVQFLHLWSHM